MRRGMSQRIPRLLIFIAVNTACGPTTTLKGSGLASVGVEVTQPSSAAWFRALPTIQIDLAPNDNQTCPPYGSVRVTVNGEPAANVDPGHWVTEHGFLGDTQSCTLPTWLISYPSNPDGGIATLHIEDDSASFEFQADVLTPRTLSIVSPTGDSSAPNTLAVSWSPPSADQADDTGLNGQVEEVDVSVDHMVVEQLRDEQWTAFDSGLAIVLDGGLRPGPADAGSLSGHVGTVQVVASARAATSACPVSACYARLVGGLRELSG
jgi:hypothetical protein